MKRRKVWRYTCEHCGKSNCSGSSISEHEKHCTANPNRTCLMCNHARDDGSQPEMDVLLEAFENDIAEMKNDEHGNLSITPTHLEIAADKCPACMLAAIRQTKMPKVTQVFKGIEDNDNVVIEIPPDVKFDYKERVKSLWADVNSNQRDWY